MSDILKNLAPACMFDSKSIAVSLLNSLPNQGVWTFFIQSFCSESPIECPMQAESVLHHLRPAGTFNFSCKLAYFDRISLTKSIAVYVSDLVQYDILSPNTLGFSPTLNKPNNSYCQTPQILNFRHLWLI